MDSSNNPIANMLVLIQAQPAGASSCTSSCPQVGIGTTDSSGKDPRDPDLSSVTWNSTYDPSNQDVTFDAYYLGSGGSWQFSQSLVEYVGDNEGASGRATFYVAPVPQRGGTDWNDCKTASTACATLLKATSDASEYLAANPESSVAVYMEPGLYQTGVGIRCDAGSCSSGCDSTATACTGLQVIDATGSKGDPIVIGPDPTSEGQVVLERPDPSDSATQQTPLLAIVDSTNITVTGLTLYGTNSINCSGSDGCNSTGCGATCSPVSGPTGEVTVEYAGNPPPPTADSGITIDDLKVENADMNCVAIQYAGGVTISNSSFDDCGYPGDNEQAGVLLGGQSETATGNQITTTSGYGILTSQL